MSGDLLIEMAPCALYSPGIRNACATRCAKRAKLRMELNGHLISDLHRFVDERGVTLSETPGHVKLNIVRSGISLSVLIPKAVLEWWVEVSDVASGAKIEDWCDYAGYDATSTQTLSEDMRTDVLSFLENAVARPLRTVADGRVLEWNVGGDWLQAIPLAPHDVDGVRTEKM